MQGKLRQEGPQAEANCRAADESAKCRTQNVYRGPADGSYPEGPSGCTGAQCQAWVAVCLILSLYLYLCLCLCLDLCLSISLSLCLSGSFVIPLSLVVPLAEQVVQGKAVSVAELRPPVKCLLPL